jgi:hypothetical protein
MTWQGPCRGRLIGEEEVEAYVFVQLREAILCLRLRPSNCLVAMAATYVVFLCVGFLQEFVRAFRIQQQCLDVRTGTTHDPIFMPSRPKLRLRPSSVHFLPKDMHDRRWYQNSMPRPDISMDYYATATALLLC